MILGVIPLSAFTILHVIISLIAIASGVIVLIAMLASHRLVGLTEVFLGTTILTSATGFLFPISGFTPALGTGIASLTVLAVALVALYGRHLHGSWRWIYVAAAVTALWFNVLVLIVQAFLKVPSLHALAPSGNEPPFVVAQSAALVVLFVLGLIAAFRFRPGRALAA